MCFVEYPFKSSATASKVTSDIDYKTQEVEIAIDSRVVCYELEAFDTPGIFDSDHFEHFDPIMKVIAQNPINQILIVIKFGRNLYELRKWLKVLDRCVNGLDIRSCSLIISRVPNQRMRENILEEDPSFDLMCETCKVYEEVCKCLEIAFTNVFYIVEEEGNEPVNPVNTKQIAIIRELIYNSEPFLNRRVTTWNETVRWCDLVVKKKIPAQEASIAMVKDLDNRKLKIEKGYAPALLPNRTKSLLESDDIGRIYIVRMVETYYGSSSCKAIKQCQKITRQIEECKSGNFPQTIFTEVFEIDNSF